MLNQVPISGADTAPPIDHVLDGMRTAGGCTLACVPTVLYWHGGFEPRTAIGQGLCIIEPCIGHCLGNVPSNESGWWKVFGGGWPRWCRVTEWGLYQGTSTYLIMYSILVLLILKPFDSRASLQTSKLVFTPDLVLSINTISSINNIHQKISS